MDALAEIDAFDADPAAVAEAMIGTPYHWGGRTAQGIDCSGLVQLAWSAAGIHLPRDRDLPLAALGSAQDVAPAGLARGGLGFFPRHVGLRAHRAPRRPALQPTQSA